MPGAESKAGDTSIFRPEAVRPLLAANRLGSRLNKLLSPGKARESLPVPSRHPRIARSLRTLAAGTKLKFLAPHLGSRLQGADLLHDRCPLWEGPACLAEPVARIALVTFQEVNDAVRPARKRRFLVHLYDLVRGAPVACFEMADRLVKLTVANFHLPTCRLYTPNAEDTSRSFLEGA